jgi:hypothetical protein
MALGIGATTMLFSVAYGVLLKPLPWSDPDQLVRVTETRQGRTGRVLGTVSNGTFLAWRDHRSTIEDLGGWLTQTATLTGAGDPVRVPIIPTTPSLFRILRVRPLIGRLFTEGEGARDQPGLVILSYGLWQERFGGRPEILGHLLQFDDKPYTVVGVMPREFTFPDRETRAWTAWSRRCLRRSSRFCRQACVTSIPFSSSGLPLIRQRTCRRCPASCTSRHRRSRSTRS